MKAGASGASGAEQEGKPVVQVVRGEELAEEDAPPDSDLRAWVRAGLAAAGGGTRLRRLEIALLDEAEMARLNARHRGRDGPTNVLSFPCEHPQSPQEGAWPTESPALLALCPAVIGAEAAALQAPPREHWAHMVVHGVLHLCGLHHQDPAQTAAMQRAETAAMRALRLADPWGRG